MQSIFLNPVLQREQTQALSKPKQKELSDLKKVCGEFESIFMHQMLKEMRKTVNKTGMISGGHAEEIFSDMLDEERAKSMSIGLGDLMYAQLSRSIINTKKP